MIRFNREVTNQHQLRPHLKRLVKVLRLWSYYRESLSR